MKIKNIVCEDFCNYSKASMFIISSICDWKCCKEQGLDIRVCQNAPLSNSKTFEISNGVIYNMYINNPITKSVVIGGLEPMLQIDEVVDLISYFRKHNCMDDFVIYTGYNKDEILTEIERLKPLKNIIIKFGRYIPNKESHFDNVLNINLISDNQYAERIC